MRRIKRFVTPAIDSLPSVTLLHCLGVCGLNKTQLKCAVRSGVFIIGPRRRASEIVRKQTAHSGWHSTFFFFVPNGFFFGSDCFFLAPNCFFFALSSTFPISIEIEKGTKRWSSKNCQVSSTTQLNIETVTVLRTKNDFDIDVFASSIEIEMSCTTKFEIHTDVLSVKRQPTSRQ